MTERDGELRLATLKSAAKALKVLHQNDIIHKGLKPSNIMLLDDNKSFAIIDFGISSVFEEGSTERNYAWRHSLNAKKGILIIQKFSA